MAWTAPATWVPNQAPTAAQLNAQIRDNLLETMPAKASDVSGNYFVASTIMNQIVERSGARSYVAALENTASTSYTNLTTPGPAVTVTTGVNALAIFACECRNNLDSNTATARMTIDATGASSIPGTDTRSICNATPEQGVMAAWHAVWYDDLTPGVNTFTAKYRVSSGEGRWANRRLYVLPY